MRAPAHPRLPVAVAVVLVACGALLQHLELGAAVERAGQLTCLSAVLLVVFLTTNLVAGNRGRR